MQFFFKFAEWAAFSQPIFKFAEWAAFSQPIFKFAECVATSSTARSLEWRAVHRFLQVRRMCGDVEHREIARMAHGASFSSSVYRFLAAEEGVHILQVPEGCVA